jgi:hypothetical protein
MKQGIYDRDGEVFAYVEGSQVYNLEGVPIGYRRGQVIYSRDDEKLWTVEGDGLYVGGESIGYLGSPMRYDN